MTQILSITIILLMSVPGIYSNFSDVTMVLHHWHHPPYVTQESRVEEIVVSKIKQLPFKGMFMVILDDIADNCFNYQGIKAKLLNNQLDLYKHNWTYVSTSPLITQKKSVHVEVFMPVWSPRGESSTFLKGLVKSYEFLQVLESPGAIHFYPHPKVPVGSDLLTVILQGWPMLVLIMLGAAYSGIIIWLLDRLWNEQNFPKPFLRGFWEGFWWAFVTMTTVGYGDTTPRSIQARVFGLVWIVVGVTILSVFTATVTTVLTQETLGNENLIQGAKVVVANGTDEARIAVKLGAQPVVQNSFEAMLQTMEEEVANAALLEQYMFAALESSLQRGSYLIEKIVENPLDIGILFVGNISEGTRICLQTRVTSQRATILSLLLEHIQPLATTTTSASEKAQKLFQPRTIRYMWFALAVWAVIFVAFVIWEFAYWRPKHRKRQAQKSEQKEVDEARKKTVFSLDGLRNSPRPGRLYRPASAPCLSGDRPYADGFNSQRSRRTPSKTLQNGFLRPGHVHARFYANRGFVGDETTRSLPSTSRSNADHSYNEPQQLDVLIKRQTEELKELEREFLSYKAQWEVKVKRTKHKHKEEKRGFLPILPLYSGSTSLNNVNAPGFSSMRLYNGLTSRNQSLSVMTSHDNSDVTMNITEPSTASLTIDVPTSS